MARDEKTNRERREQEHANLLREALARPGVREAMEVYQNWQRTDQGLDSYREATKDPQIITTTDHANSQ